MMQHALNPKLNIMFFLGISLFFFVSCTRANETVVNKPTPNNPPYITQYYFVGTEQRKLIGRIPAVDPDSDPISYALSGIDSSVFAIHSSTGELSFVSTPNYQTLYNQNINTWYKVDVTVSDNINVPNTFSISISVLPEISNLVTLLNGIRYIRTITYDAEAKMFTFTGQSSSKTLSHQDFGIVDNGIAPVINHVTAYPNTRPQGLKFFRGQEGYPFIQWNGKEYWPLSFLNNSFNIAILVY